MRDPVIPQLPRLVQLEARWASAAGEGPVPAAVAGQTEALRSLAFVFGAQSFSRTGKKPDDRKEKSQRESESDLEVNAVLVADRGVFESRMSHPTYGCDDPQSVLGEPVAKPGTDGQPNRTLASLLKSCGLPAHSFLS